jgi:hypothetical protein
MGKGKGKAEGIFSKIFNRRPQTPSTQSGSDHPRASGDTTPPNPQPRSEAERLETSSGSHGQSETEQFSSSQPYQPPPADPGTRSTEVHNEQPSRPLRQQEGQAPPRLVTEILWEKAASGLDPEDQEKLGLIKSKREGQAADPDVVSHIVSRAKELKEENKEATWRPVGSIPSPESLRNACS